MTLKAMLVSVLCFFIGSIFAADPSIYSDKKHGAIKGADVVAYFSLDADDDAVIGDKSISYEYQDATWYFSSEANRDLFMAEPEKYIPQYGGYCAFAVSKGFTKPIDPNRWQVVDGKLYLNFNWIANKRWSLDKAASIADGDANWPQVLTACEAHDNCYN